MPRRSLASALTVLLCGLLLTACAPSFLAVKQEIAPSLLLPYADSVLAPENPSDNELAAERIRGAKAYVDCRDKHAALSKRVSDEP